MRYMKYICIVILFFTLTIVSPVRGDPIITTIDSGPHLDGSSLELNARGFPTILYVSVNDLILNVCGNIYCDSGNTKTTIDGPSIDPAFGDLSYTTMVLNANGFPVIAYSHATPDSPAQHILKIVTCGNSTCTSGNVTTKLEEGLSPIFGLNLRLNDSGFPVLIYGIDNDLKLLHCGNIACDSGNVSTIVDDTGGPLASGINDRIDMYSETLNLSSSEIPTITYHRTTIINTNYTEEERLVVCGDPACSINNTFTTLFADNRYIGRNFTLKNDIPIFSYFDTTDLTQKLVICGNAVCSSGNTVSNIEVDTPRRGSLSSITLNGRGFPVFFVTHYTDIENAFLSILSCRNQFCMGKNTLIQIDMVYGSNPGIISGGFALRDNDFPIFAYTLVTGFANVGNSLKVVVCDTKTCADSPTPTATPNTPEVVSQPQITVFDPSISKIGLLHPGEAGVTGELLEWVVTVSNIGNGTGNNVVITDNLQPELKVDHVEAPGGIVKIDGQIVTVTYPSLLPGQGVQFSIFTTVRSGSTVNNTACLHADNLDSERCATGQLIRSLPITGETPWWRNGLLAALSATIGLIMIWGLRRVCHRHHSL